MKARILDLYFRLLGKLANRYLQKTKPYIIGINWSVGKTSCRMIVYQTLEKFLPNKVIYTSPKNFNGELGLSLSIFKIESWNPNVVQFIKTLIHALKITLKWKHMYDVIVLEYGIDRPKEMEFLVSIAKPHMWIFTAIDAVHSLQFGNPAAIANEEVKMIKNTLEIAFLNENDTYAMQLNDMIDIDKFIYQTQGHESDADIKFEDEKFVYKENNVWAQYTQYIKNQKFTIETNLLGKAHYGYIGVALTIADILHYQYQGKSLDSDNGTLKLEYSLQPGRMTILPGIHNSLLIDSTYNASPLSMRKILDTSYKIKNQLFPDRKMWLILGDMRELWDLTQEEHRKLAAYVQWVADRVFLVGENMIKHMSDELEKIWFDMDMVHTFVKSTDAADLVQELLEKSGDDHIIVGKWSQNTIFIEEAIKKLLENDEDIKKLTRQSDWWDKTKWKFFEE